MPTARVFTLTTTAELVQYQNHTSLGSSASTSHLRPGCDGLASPLASSTTDGRTVHTTLAPGTYTFIACDGRTGTFVSEPQPITANPNTSCATAAAMVSQYTVSHRVYDATKLYFTHTASQDGAKSVYLQNVSPPQMTAGRCRIEVQTTCDDSANDLVDRIGSAHVPSEDPTVVTVVSGTKYWIVLSEIDPGMQPSLRVDF
jgi:hypothetical protein